MSLVNDMLRDLDARRREAPTRGLGAEKLVPATEAAARRSRRRVLAVAFVLLCSLAIVAAFLTMNGRGGATGSLAPVQVAPGTVSGDAAGDAATGQSDARARIQSEPQAQDNAAERARDDAALTELEARLARLEQQNQALREQASPDPSTQAGSLQNQSSQALSGARQEVSPDWQRRDWSPESTSQAVTTSPDYDTRDSVATDQIPDVPLSTEETVMHAPAADADGSSSRSPRAMSFEDRDRQQVQLALQQWSSGQRLTALQTLDAFTYENAEAHRARETLAKLLMQQGEAERALQVVELGLSIAPRFDGYRKIKARVLLGEGNAEQVPGLLSANAPSVSADTEYHDLLATAYLSSQRFGDAVVSYQMLLQQDETVGRWWYGMGAALDAQGRTSDAASAYERALRSGELSANLRQNSQQRLQALRQSTDVN